MDFSVAVTVLSAVWALSSLSATVATAAYRAQLRPLRPIPALGRVAVILPVRSPAPQLPAALNALQAQNWPNLRLLVVLESEADPAFAVVRAAASADPRVVPVLAGESSACGQKVHNLLAGLGHLDQDVHIVVFVDADAIPPPDFLRILLRPILVGRTRVSSGYRVLVPEPGPLGALLAAIADHAVATFPRLPSRVILWGGAIGLRRDAAEGLDLSRTWKGALSDDLTLTRRARLAGERMHGVHAALVPTPVCYTLAEAFRFGVRQLRLLRLHLPLEWGMVGLVSLLPAIAAATVATGHPAALAACLLAFTCLQLRLSLRQRIFSQVLPLAATVPVARAVRLARLLFPLAHLLRLACWLASGFGRRIAWAGIDYEVAGINCVRILARRPPRER